MSETLGLLLVRAGVIRRQDLYQALEIQRETGRFIGSVLLALGSVTPEELRTALSKQLALPFAHGREVLNASENLRNIVPIEVIERYRVVPFAKGQDVISLALYDSEAADALSEIAFFMGCQVKGYLCDEAVVERTIARLYPAVGRPMAKLPQSIAKQSLSKEEPLAHDRRRPGELMRPVEEISNRDFARALGLEEIAQESEPIPLVQRAKARTVEVKIGARAISVVDAAERVFASNSVLDIAEVGVRFLRNHFGRAVAFDMHHAPAQSLALSGFSRPVTSLDLTKHNTLAEVIQSNQSFHGKSPRGKVWDVFFQEMGGPRPGSLLVAPVHNKYGPRLLFYADCEGQLSQENIHNVGVLVREITTALSLMDPKSEKKRRG